MHMEIQLIIEGLECLTTKQHKCEGCPFNPVPGRAWPYGCGKGQTVMVKAAKEWLKQLEPMAPILVRERAGTGSTTTTDAPCAARTYITDKGIARIAEGRWSGSERHRSACF